jgi:WD40 repeat protein
VSALAFSPDGRLLASASLDKTAKIWDAATGKEVRTLPHSVADFDMVWSIAFSPDGRQLATGSWEKNLRLWDVASGRELHKIKVSTGSGLEPVFSVAFSPDGRRVAAGGGSKTIKLYDSGSGRELKVLSGHGATVGRLAFSPDGKMLASGSLDLTIKLWDSNTGRELRTIQRTATGEGEGVGAVAFSPDSRLLASGEGFRNFVLRAVDSGQIVRDLTGSSNSTFGMAFSQDGRWLALAEGKSVNLWEPATGGMAATLGACGKPMGQSLAFNPAGRLLAGICEKTVVVWDVASRVQVQVLTHGGLISSVAFSADGKWLASLDSHDNTIKVWEVATWKLARNLPVRDPSHTVVFAADGEPGTGRELTKLEGKVIGDQGHWYATFGPQRDPWITAIWSIALSPDGRWLAAGNIGGMPGERQSFPVELWEARRQHEPYLLKGHKGGVFAVAFSPDGRWLASGSEDNTIRIWDLATRKELRTLSAHTSGIYALAFSRDSRWLISAATTEGGTRIWDPATGDLVATLVSFYTGPDMATGRNWILTTPDGLFDGSPEAWGQVLWRFNNNTFDVAPVELFFNEYYYPGLLAEILAGKRPKAHTSIENKDRRQPVVQVSAAGGQASRNAPSANRNVTLTINVSQAAADEAHKTGSGVRDVRLFRNGSLVKVWRGDLKLDAQGKAVLEATVPIVAGENRFTAYAFNHDNIKSSDATLVVSGAESLKRKGTAYVIAVGINEYATEALNLKFAVPDADSVVKELSGQQAKLGTYANIEVIPLLDKDATKANFLLALERLAGAKTGALPAGVPAALAKLKPAQPEDAVLIYFAGHGYVAEEKDHKRFYLIMHEFEPVEVAAKVPGAVSDIELGEAVEKIDAGLMALLIDACQSGGALDSPDPRQGPMNSKGLAQLAYDKGMYVLAAQGNQAALEVNKLGHGLLTHALVGTQEGLTSAADADKSGDVVVREWLDYATQRVPQLQEEKIEEARQQGRSLTFFKKPAPLGTPSKPGEAARGDAPSTGVQRPRVFYRREPEPQPPVIARPEVRP